MKKYLFILMSIVAISACNNDHTKTVSTTTQDTTLEITLSKHQLEVMNITFAKPQKKNISKTIEAFGEIITLPTDRATINTKVKGIVENIFVHEGQNVKKGDALFSISSSDIIDWQDAYLRAKGQLIYLEKEYQRQKSLSAQNVSSRKNLEMAESEFFQAQSQLKIALAKLQNAGLNINENDTNFVVKKSIIVRAPLSGNITEILVNIGSGAIENSPLCQIVSIDNLHAHIQIHPVDAALVQENMKADLYINNSPQPIAANIEYISKEINAATKSVSLHIGIPRVKNVLSGMPVKSKIYVQRKDAFVLPASALYNDGERYHIFYIHKVINDTNFVIRPYFVPKELVAEKEFAIPDLLDAHLDIIISGTNFVNGEMHKDEMQE